MNATIASTTVVDPVCGMRIDLGKAVGSSKFSGETYHFCSRGCETKFDAEPKRYTAAASAEAAGCCSPKGHSCC
ncbi:MAG: YHS domain-containing protein [Thermoanaerobaculia bacterium]